MRPQIAVIIPARDEEQAIGKVVKSLKQIRDKTGTPLFDTIMVCDNGSQDNTAQCALQAGASVVYQHTPGYGLACLTAIAQLKHFDILLFMDGDNAFRAEQAIPLVEAISRGADVAIGSRVLGKTAPGALTFPQRAGNRLASLLIRHLWGTNVTDLGPLRAISRQAYHRLDMQDTRFGWTVEMQIKAVQQGMRVEEYPVDTYRRIGRSKISGTIKGTIGASVGILSTIARLWWQQDQRQWHTRRRSVRNAPVTVTGEHRP